MPCNGDMDHGEDVVGGCGRTSPTAALVCELEQLMLDVELPPFDQFALRRCLLEPALVSAMDAASHGGTNGHSRERGQGCQVYLAPPSPSPPSVVTGDGEAGVTLGTLQHSRHAEYYRDMHSPSPPVASGIRNVRTPLSTRSSLREAVARRLSAHPPPPASVSLERCTKRSEHPQHHHRYNRRSLVAKASVRTASSPKTRAMIVDRGVSSLSPSSPRSSSPPFPPVSAAHAVAEVVGDALARQLRGGRSSSCQDCAYTRLSALRSVLLAYREALHALLNAVAAREQVWTALQWWCRRISLEIGARHEALLDVRDSSSGCRRHAYGYRDRGGRDNDSGNDDNHAMVREDGGAPVSASPSGPSAPVCDVAGGCGARSRGETERLRGSSRRRGETAGHFPTTTAIATPAMARPSLAGATRPLSSSGDVRRLPIASSTELARTHLSIRAKGRPPSANLNDELARRARPFLFIRATQPQPSSAPVQSSSSLPCTLRPPSRTRAESATRGIPAATASHGPRAKSADAAAAGVTHPRRGVHRGKDLVPGDQIATLTTTPVVANKKLVAGATQSEEEMAAWGVSPLRRNVHSPSIRGAAAGTECMSDGDDGRDDGADNHGALTYGQGDRTVDRGICYQDCPTSTLTAVIPRRVNAECVRYFLFHLQRTTVLVVHELRQWRRHLTLPFPFIMENTNYTLELLLQSLRLATDPVMQHALGRPPVAAAIAGMKAGVAVATAATGTLCTTAGLQHTPTRGVSTSANAVAARFANSPTLPRPDSDSSPLSQRSYEEDTRAARHQREMIAQAASSWPEAFAAYPLASAMRPPLTARDGVPPAHVTVGNVTDAEAGKVARTSVRPVTTRPLPSPSPSSAMTTMTAAAAEGAPRERGASPLDMLLMPDPYQPAAREHDDFNDDDGGERNRTHAATSTAGGRERGGWDRRQGSGRRVRGHRGHRTNGTSCSGSASPRANSASTSASPSMDAATRAEEWLGKEITRQLACCRACMAAALRDTDGGSNLDHRRGDPNGDGGLPAVMLLAGVQRLLQPQLVAGAAQQLLSMDGEGAMLWGAWIADVDSLYRHLEEASSGVEL